MKSSCDMTTKTDQTRTRIRAPRACLRCKEKKVQCDGAEAGLPCTRCNQHELTGCAFGPSKRGMHVRKKCQRRTSNDKAITIAISDGMGPDSIDVDNQGYNDIQPAQILKTAQQYFTNTDVSWLAGNEYEDAEPSVVMTDYDSAYDLSRDRSNTASEGSSHSSLTTYSSIGQGNSLASMFEGFLHRQGARHEGVLEKCGVIFLGQSSPFTFALEELLKGKRPDLHHTDFGIPLAANSSKDHEATESAGAHGSHMCTQDIEFLCHKGAFTSPKHEVSTMLFDAFAMRFCPLYSIVNIKEMRKLHEQRQLPWVLLHAICLLGATYCDQNVIYHAGFESRWHARRAFYDKAKVMFDMGYETDKIVLLQVVLMLSFWGPQMKSYWNPCSWIGFAVTIAESLGIQRATTTAHLVNADQKGLLRRLWWTVVRRDAYCAALLGRPFRINISQCDASMLSLEDFNEITSDSTGFGQALFQIHSAKLSLVLRSIVQQRFGPTNPSITVQHLHNMLQQWRAGLPALVDWGKQTNATDIFSTSLKIMFYHHLIFIYLHKPVSEFGQIPLADQIGGLSSPQIAETAAQMISSTAFNLIKHSMVGKMPHEVFPGFFVAGIVFYRQLQQPQDLLASLGRAALDNCQLVMNEANGRWDASHWVLRIFEFLLFESQQTTEAGVESIIEFEQDRTDLLGTTVDPTTFRHLGRPVNAGSSTLHSVETEPPQNSVSGFNDFLVMPNYFVSTADDRFRLDF